MKPTSIVQGHTDIGVLGGRARMTPRTHLLSNGRYSVMITGAGSGYSNWRDLAITRWRADVTRDAAGMYIFFGTPEVAIAGRPGTSREASSRTATP